MKILSDPPASEKKKTVAHPLLRGVGFRGGVPINREGKGELQKDLTKDSTQNQPFKRTQRKKKDNKNSPSYP